jgi:hypothetical protein
MSNQQTKLEGGNKEKGTGNDRLEPAMLYPVPSASSFVSLRSSKQVWMGRMRQSRSSVFIVLFICCYCWRWPLEVDGSHVGENLADFAWNLIGAISRIRRGHDDALDRDDQSAPSTLLDDPRFLYTTLYRFILLHIPNSHE